MSKPYAYIFDEKIQQVTAGTSSDIETLADSTQSVHYFASQQEMAEEVKQYYHRECIITLATHLNIFEKELFDTV
ncbi:hypothetical protein ATL39_2537 [Sinobaca qinghaiensis]|uniref:Uncharacterized protein n=1 Tax=Sinobaca qinghaiensis TaxID=342944 RepID=A0A419UZN2_9BACL|nr:hypothetical protein [Sinobaca qinghaiensis]RKD71143.1 hypothetical protein ATL39_2537 [Sinobaca qinghaiensis]